MPASAKTVIPVLQENSGLLADAKLWLFSVPHGLTGGEGLLGCPAGAIWGEATASDTIDLWWWCSLLLTTVLLCLTTSFPLWG